MFGNDNCPVCFGILEEIGVWGLDAEDKTYGCRKCNATYHYKRPTGCFGEAGFIKQEETLTEYERLETDRPQAEIRLKVARLNSVLDLAKKARDEANELYGQIESLCLKDLRVIQENCSHPNRTEDRTRCLDCTYFFDLSQS